MTSLKLPAFLTVVNDWDVRAIPADAGIATGQLATQIFLSSQADHENTVMKAHYAAGTWTHWHSHPLGQTLYILSGVCLVQREGGGIFRANAGDVVWLAPDEMHRHGATDDEPMSYLSIQGVKHGTYSRWRESSRTPECAGVV